MRQKFINNCDICQNNKYKRQRIQTNINLTQMPNKPFERKYSNEKNVNTYRGRLKIINALVKSRIKNQKFKRNKQIHTLPEKIPKKVKVKMNKRQIHKIKCHFIKHMTWKITILNLE